LHPSDGFLGMITHLFQVDSPLLDQGEGGAPFACDFQFRCEAHQQLKQGETSGVAWPGVVHKLGHGQPIGPIILLEVPIDLQILLHPLVSPLGLSISLGMEGRADVLINA